jgi:hypothetical protein
MILHTKLYRDILTKIERKVYTTFMWTTTPVEIVKYDHIRYADTE